MTSNTHKSVAVVDDEKSDNTGARHVICRFDTVDEAETFIATSALIDPDQMERGGYGIDAPEHLVNPTT